MDEASERGTSVYDARLGGVDVAARPESLLGNAVE